MGKEKRCIPCLSGVGGRWVSIVVGRAGGFSQGHSCKKDASMIPSPHFGGIQKRIEEFFVCQRKIFTTTTRHTQTPPEHGEHDNRHHSCSSEYTRRYMFKQCFLHIAMLSHQRGTSNQDLPILSHQNFSIISFPKLGSGKWCNFQWSMVVEKKLEKVWKCSKGIFPFNKNPFGPWGHRIFLGEFPPIGL